MSTQTTSSDSAGDRLDRALAEHLEYIRSLQVPTTLPTALAQTPTPQPSNGKGIDLGQFPLAGSLSNLLSVVPDHLREEIRQLMTPPTTQPALIENHSQPQSDAQTLAACPFLDDFPLEVRNMIYGYLLVNPELGEVTSIQNTYGPDGRTDAYGAKVKYGLSPAILRVNKKIHGEAMTILYDRNRFYLACRADDTLGEDNYCNLHSPVTRYVQTISKWDYPLPKIQDIVAIRHVQHWNMTLSVMTSQNSMYADDEYADDYETSGKTLSGFVEFCRELSFHPPKTLHIAIGPRARGSRKYYDVNDESARGVLRPLCLIRNVDRVTFKNATMGEIPEDTRDFIALLASFGRSKSKVPKEEFKARLETLMTSDSNAAPFERLWLQNEALLRYVYHLAHLDFCHNYKVLDMVPEFTEKLYPGSMLAKHCVEKWLFEAQNKVDEEDNKAFKSLRRSVLEYLEPQYKKLVAASTKLHKFLKEEKHVHGPFLFAGCFELEFQAEAMVLLEEYMKAFLRDLTTEVRIELKLKKYHSALDLNMVLGGSHRTLLYKQLEAHYLSDMKEVDGNQFMALYRQVVDCCNIQYLQIRHARKVLFDWDDERVSSRNCDINLELPAYDISMLWDADFEEVQVDLEQGTTQSQDVADQQNIEVTNTTV